MLPARAFFILMILISPVVNKIDTISFDSWLYYTQVSILVAGTPPMLAN